MIRAEVDGWMDGWMDARQVLPFWCFWPVSDLFLTFPGVFFNFKKVSTGSQTRNNFSDRQSNIITSAPNTSTSATSSSSRSSRRRSSRSSNSSNSNSRSSNDKSWGGWMGGWMDRWDARQVLPFWCFWPVSDLFSIGASLNVLLTWKHLRGFRESPRAESARPCQLLAWFWSRK